MNTIPATSASFDVIVVGGGHAGCEAAAAAARLGARTALITHKLSTIGAMSCNPAIGGIGKGHLVCEVDALDGLMGRAADRAGIHFKLLNRSKGPAVRGLRAQTDRTIYKAAIRDLLEATLGLCLLEGEVETLLLDDGVAGGVTLSDGGVLKAGAVVLTTGTFLGGMIHVGDQRVPAGRVGDPASLRLTDSLRALSLPLGRLKTGTPPRLDGRTIAWDGLQLDHGDANPEPFSRLTDTLTTRHVPCHITYTTEATHAVIRRNLHQSAVYGGAISGRGPRYCPSIEDKVVRFADRDRHQIFLEPEGLDTDTIYPNGISTSLPEAVQREIIASIPGLSEARITQAGYAIEYDYVDPRCLDPTLEVRAARGLFLAGQINGTTGYEEAAAQGVLAGINAARRAGAGDGVMISRSEAYIGVLIDDLTSQGITEPYRMFTSRSEFRLSLRCDNADLRLTRRGIEIGCVGLERRRRLEATQAETTAILIWARDTQVRAGGGGARKSVFAHLVAGASSEAIGSECEDWWQWSDRARAHLLVEAHYDGYLARQQGEIRHIQQDEAVTLPRELDYGALPGLSRELRDTLNAVRPTTIGGASRLQGMTPAALVVLLGHARRAHA